MMGRNQEALVWIPKMDGHQIIAERNYLYKSFTYVSVLGVFPLILLRFAFIIDDKTWAILSLALISAFFNMVAISLLAQKAFARHLLLNLTMFGGSLLVFLGLLELNLIDVTLSIAVLILFRWLSVHVGLLIMVQNVRHSDDTKLTSMDENHQHETVWGFTRFSRSTGHYFAVEIVATVVPIIGIFLLEFWDGLVAVAFFAMALLLYRLSRVFSWIVFVVFAPILAESHDKKPLAYVQAFRESLGYTLLFQGILTIGLVAFALPIMNLLAGPTYAISAFLLTLLLLGGVFDSFYQVCASILRTSGHSGLLFRVNVLVFIISIALTTAMVYWMGLIGAAISFVVTVVTQGILASLAVVYSESEYPEVMMPRKTLGKAGIWSLVAVAFVLVSMYVNETMLVVVCFVGITCYVLAGRALGMFRFADFVTIVKSILE